MLICRILGPLVVGLVATSCWAADWKPAAGPLLTRFAKEIRPDKVWSEYPRPQMVRRDWQNLNGLWQFAVAERQIGATDRQAVGRTDSGAVSRRVGIVRHHAAAPSASGIDAPSRCPRAGPAST